MKDIHIRLRCPQLPIKPSIHLQHLLSGRSREKKPLCALNLKQNVFSGRAAVVISKMKFIVAFLALLEKVEGFLKLLSSFFNAAKKLLTNAFFCRRRRFVCDYIVIYGQGPLAMQVCVHVLVKQQHCTDNIRVATKTIRTILFTNGSLNDASSHNS